LLVAVRRHPHFIIPQARLKARARLLADYFKDIRVYRLTAASRRPCIAFGSSRDQMFLSIICEVPRSQIQTSTSDREQEWIPIIIGGNVERLRMVLALVSIARLEAETEAEVALVPEAELVEAVANPN
jgi:hypothetical protein